MTTDQPQYTIKPMSATGTLELFHALVQLCPRLAKKEAEALPLIQDHIVRAYKLGQSSN